MAAIRPSETALYHAQIGESVAPYTFHEIEEETNRLSRELTGGVSFKL